jgi:hypothetical protein
VKGKHEENEILIAFSDLSRDESIYNAMIELERYLAETVCQSCNPVPSKNAESVDDSMCMGFLGAMASIGYNNKVCYQIVLHFPLQNEEAIKSLTKMVKAKIKEFLLAKKIECQYDLEYSKRKEKIKDGK